MASPIPQRLARDGHVLGAIEPRDQVAVDLLCSREHLGRLEARDHAQFALAITQLQGNLYPDILFLNRLHPRHQKQF
ncbi:MAG: hypothetical protein LBR95_01770 [Azoarcus sp.]|nr:hypothetical protein [Azoarcus sp.]